MRGLNASHMHMRPFRSTKVLVFSGFYKLVTHIPLAKMVTAKIAIIYSSDDLNYLKTVIFPSPSSKVSYDNSTKQECIYIGRLIAISGHHSLCLI